MDFGEKTVRIVVCAIACIAIAIMAWLMSLDYAGATWKPTGDEHQAVTDWYQSAKLTPAAQEHFPFKSCCEKADRFRTKFLVDKSSGDDQWYYWVDNVWLPIPWYIIHYEGIHTKDPRYDNLPEIKQMRLDGVLFIYNGKTTCFWPPEAPI